jgi:hypothetical protein
MQTINKFTPIAASLTPLSSQLPFALFVASYDWRQPPIKRQRMDRAPVHASLNSSGDRPNIPRASGDRTTGML